MQLTIRNYDKFMGRKDIIHCWWFKLSNTILEDPDFYDFSAEELKAWIYICSQASKQKRATIEIHFEHANRSCRLKRQVIESALEKLISRGICTQSVRDPAAIRPAEERRGEEKRRENTYAHFEKCASELYSLYPKKIGKKAGWVRLKTILKSEEEFNNLKTAIANYKSKLERDKTEARFIKQFDTFLSSWEDWLDPTTGTGQDFSEKNKPMFSQEEWDEITRGKNVTA